MLEKFKRFLYFPVASYFAFFAKIRLSRWNPRVIVITGSSGKTTTLNLIESLLGEAAHYSHHANSAIGLPFDVLGLRRKTLQVWEWPFLFIRAPINAFARSYPQKLYVAEADVDRHPEGRFLANFLKPEVVLWVSSARTHSMNFDYFVRMGKFNNVEEAIAYEFGYFIEKAKALSIVNGDSRLIEKELPRASSKIIRVSLKNLKSYEVSLAGTEFEIGGNNFLAKKLLPREFYYSIAFTSELLKYLGVDRKIDISKIILPPGRNSLFAGIKKLKILDSTYNSNLSSMKTILEMFENLKSEKKWAVIGDMLEQGESEKEEHEELAEILSKMDLKRIIMLGPRLKDYTYPKLKNSVGQKVIIETFLTPKEVLEYLQKNISGGELILFKGARFLEGVIENLLENKNDVKHLARREKVWEIRRKKWGL